MAKSKSSKRKPTRTPFQRWCDNYGHGARAYLQKRTGLRWQTIHVPYTGSKPITAATAKKLEAATEGVVPWTSFDIR